MKIPFLNYENCGELLKNPDRGLRMETYITLGEELDSYPKSNEEPFGRAQGLIDKYKSDSPTLCQVYVYLCNYNNRPLDDLAFDQMKRFFELFRQNGIRMLLRFTYQMELTEDAPYNIVKGHIEQLKKWFSANEGLINDTLYCMQTGIVGLWGEGHSNVNLKKRDIKKVIHDVCDLAPDGIYSQIRTYDMLKKVKKSDLPKVGIHDDYIIGDITHKWSFIPKITKNYFKYNRTMKHALLTVNDGEMPWGGAKLNDSSDGASLDTLDGKAILNQLQTYSLTSFSLEHNYREKDGKFSMYAWRNELLSYDEACSLGISVNPNLFKNSKNESVKMSIYDIIRYHLGYQLALSDYEFENGKVSFTVTNFGFAPPLNFNYFALVCRDSSTDELYEKEISEYNKTLLLSGKSVRFSVPCSAEPIGLKLATQKGRTQTVRFANDTQYEDGVQYFG